MRKALGFLLPMLFAGALAVGVAGCDAAQNAMDCASICDRYMDCWDENYDVGQCRSDCRDRANDDPDFERKVGSCASCIEDRACDSTFACVIDCAGVVP